MRAARFRRRHDLFLLELGHAAQRHQFDEPDLPGIVQGQAGQFDHFVFVEATRDHAVDLDGRQPGGGGRCDSLSNAQQRIAPGDVLELARIQRVDADVHLVQARLGQRLRQLAQPDAVGGHGDAPDAGNGANGAHQRNEAGAHGRLAAGQPDLVHAQAGAHAHQRQDFVILQQGRRWSEGDILRHAVDAPQVTRVCE